MGTSGAYGGSGGQAWRNARRRTRRLPGQPSAADINGVVSAIGAGLPGDNPPLAAEGGDDGSGGAAEQAQGQAQAPTLSYGPISARPSPGRGGGGGAGGGGGGGREPAGGRGGGTQRQARRAARAGSRAFSAGSALAAGNTALLQREFGLVLDELRDLPARMQAKRIADRIVVGDSIESAEIKEAVIALLVAQQDPDHPLDPVQAAQVFMTAWITAVAETEILGTLADGKRSDTEIKDIARQVRDAIRAKVEGLVTEGMETMDSQAIFDEVYRRAKHHMTALGAAG